MKRSSIYLVTILLFIAATGFIILRYNKSGDKKSVTGYSLLERKEPSAATEEWKETRKRAANLLEIIKYNPTDTKSMISLAGIFIQEARITGNYMYYDMAAMKYVNTVLSRDSSNFNALTLKSLIYLSQHHFADGLAIAEKAKAVNPYNSFVYGILVDANVEMGNYDSAVANADKMVSIRPDIRSYSRISYLREIYGDYPGAIEAMKMAVEAGLPGDEATEWSRVQLGRLYESTGDIKIAQMQYQISLDARPSYAYALAGMGRIDATNGDYAKAISNYMEADSLVNDYSFKEELSDLYALSGEKEKSQTIAKQVIDGMSADAEAGRNNDNIGHYADRELAYAYLKVKNYDKAIEHAMAEYNRRPDNIDVNETVAWTLYSAGNYDKALPYMKLALKTGSKNPTLLCRAGLLYNKTGDKLAAKALLKQALNGNSQMAVSLKKEGMDTLASL